ncbi:MAG: hypothetical protein ACOZQL_36720 [Myxococcota bacterium]
MKRLTPLLLLLACRPELPPPGEPPSPAVLRVDDALVWAKTATLRGDATPGTLAQLFVDDACAGALFREVSAEALAAGVEVQLVGGENVFTARLVSAAGLRSACSNVVRLERRLLPPYPSTPIVQVLPRPVANTTSFRLTGTVDRNSRARLRQTSSCEGELLGELTREEFATVGFAVTGTPDIWRSFGVEAVDPVGRLSACTAVELLSDLDPPLIARLEFGSPNPSGQATMFVVAIAAEPLSVFEGPDCQGAELRLTAQQLAVPPVATWRWSALARDEAGNETCREGEPFSFDAQRTRPPVELRVMQGLLQARVPTSEEFVELSLDAACQGTSALRITSGTLVISGVSLSSLGAPNPTITARGWNAVDGWGPCSAPVQE